MRAQPNSAALKNASVFGAPELRQRAGRYLQARAGHFITSFVFFRFKYFTVRARKHLCLNQQEKSYALAARRPSLAGAEESILIT